MISQGIGDTVNEVQKNNRGGTGRVSPAEDNPGITEKMGLNLYNFLQSEPVDLIKINDNGLKTELTNNNVSHWKDLKPPVCRLIGMKKKDSHKTQAYRCV